MVPVGCDLTCLHRRGMDDAAAGGQRERGRRTLRRDEIQRQVDAVRAERSELENHIIDEYRAGCIGRREFIRRGAVVGMSMPLVAFLASACGSGDKGSSGSEGAEANKADVK